MILSAFCHLQIANGILYPGKRKEERGKRKEGEKGK